ncbi:Endophilin-B1 [Fragariocoptes setiger]|uniref:Endophilin-B1 n=1 Tax=Fragariocoptes setiger TaxID=1670756 RepID=A0ABQ7S4Z6_9ACAR|nr:Endophilin-B1 [Fragariocoptes setiger]
MSPVKIAIATFVVSLIGLTASAPNEKGSSSGSGKCVAGIKNIEAANPDEKLGANKQASTKLHLYDTDRKDFKANGAKGKEALVREQVQIDPSEEQARKKKLERRETEQARARRQQFDELEDRLNGSHAEELNWEQAKQRYGARAEEVYSEYEEQLNGAQFGEDTLMYPNWSDTLFYKFTEERLGTCEKTELDGYFENLLSRVDQTKSWTEKIVASAEAVLYPNPNNRYEDFIMEKFVAGTERKERLRNLEWLGSDMIGAGTELSPGDNYGSALIRVGQAQLKLGQGEREFVGKAHQQFVRPLRKFLDEDIKILTKERRTLEIKRLDLDAAKSRFKKARHNETNVTLSFDHNVSELEQAEAELDTAQSEFDKQVVLVQSLCDSVISTNEEHVKYLRQFIQLQADYYSQASDQLAKLLEENTDLRP